MLQKSGWIVVNIPTIYLQGFFTSRRWLGMGFLNHQQYVWDPIFQVPRIDCEKFQQIPGSLGNDTYGNGKLEDQGLGGLFQNYPKSPKPPKMLLFEFVQLSKKKTVSFETHLYTCVYIYICMCGFVILCVYKSKSITRIYIYIHLLTYPPFACKHPPPAESACKSWWRPRILDPCSVSSSKSWPTMLAVILLMEEILHHLGFQ